LTDHSNIAKVGCCFPYVDITMAINIADVRARMEQQGALPITNTPEQFDAIIRNDTERNTKILRDAGVAAN
jgi:tripartite-type tricarboxylate transporter receptor subunit TctC